MIANTTGWTSGHLPAEHGRSIFAADDAIAGGFAMPAAAGRSEKDGLRVSGTWSWGSSTSHCTMIGGGIRVVDADGNAASLADGTTSASAFFDPHDVEILDTWYVGGLKGRAGNDYRVDGALVPGGRWVDLVSARERGPVIDAPLYHVPFFGAFACSVAAVIGGLARRAVDELIALSGKQPAGSRRGLAKRAAIQVDMARADAAVRSTSAFMADAIGTATEAVAAGSVTDEHRRVLRLAPVDRCHRAAGGTAVYETSPLARVFRDTHAASQHAMVSERILEPIGTMAFGLDIDTTQI